MEPREQDKITAFDTLFTNNHIQILKILMSRFDVRTQSFLAVYIKYMELQYTMAYFKQHPHALTCCSAVHEEPDMEQICDEILPFCTAEEKEKIEQIKNMMQSMNHFKEMAQMMELMKDMFPEGFNGMNPDMLTGLFNNDPGGMGNIFSMFENLDIFRQDPSS